MVCNLSDVDKQGFSATIDNIVTLLMTKMDANKAAIKEDVSQVLDFLMDKAVIRKIKTKMVPKSMNSIQKKSRK